MIDLKDIAEKLLLDLQEQRRDLVHMSTGVKLLYERIAEVLAEGNKPVGQEEQESSSTGTEHEAPGPTSNGT